MARRDKDGGPRPTQRPSLPASRQSPIQPRAAASLVIQQEQFHSRSSPIPSAQELAAYKELLPDAPERIFRVFEQQVAHRIAIETEVVTNNSRSEQTGLRYAAGICVLLLALCAYMVSQGQSVPATWLAGGQLTALAGVFIWGRRASESDLKRKRESTRQAEK